MNYKAGLAVAVAWLAAAAFLASEVHETAAAVICNPMELTPCCPAITGPYQEPSELCCTKLMEQQPCFCDYLKDPELKPYINSNTTKVVTKCGVQIPACG